MTKKTAKRIKQASRLAAIVFAVTGWNWASSRPPTAKEIETAYINLLKYIEEGSEECSTGRLVVKNSELGLEFLMDLGGS